MPNNIEIATSDFLATRLDEIRRKWPRIDDPMRQLMIAELKLDAEIALLAKAENTPSLDELLGSVSYESEIVVKPTAATGPTKVYTTGEDEFAQIWAVNVVGGGGANTLTLRTKNSRWGIAFNANTGDNLPVVRPRDTLSATLSAGGAGVGVVLAVVQKYVSKNHGVALYLLGLTATKFTGGASFVGGPTLTP